MSDALKRAEHYRDLAKRYLRLAASTENPNHYLRIAVQNNALAEAEELSTSHGDGDWPFDRFGLMRSEEHTSELQSHLNLVCRLLLEKKKKTYRLLPHHQSHEAYNVLPLHRPP